MMMLSYFFKSNHHNTKQNNRKELYHILKLICLVQFAKQLMLLEIILLSILLWSFAWQVYGAKAFRNFMEKRRRSEISVVLPD